MFKQFAGLAVVALLLGSLAVFTKANLPAPAENLAAVTATGPTSDLNKQILTLAVQPKADTAKLKELSSQRKVLMRSLAKSSSAAFLALALKSNQKSLLPAEIQSDIESETTLTSATLEVLHVDDFKNPSNSRFEYFIHQGTDRWSLQTTSLLNLQSGTKVSLSGFRLEDSLVVNTTNLANFSVLSAPPIDSVGEQKTLVIPIRWSDSINPSTSLTQSQISNLVFQGGFQNFIKEASYDRASFSGDVLNWVTFPGVEPNDCTGGADTSNPAIQNAILQSGFNLANYGLILYFGHGYCSGVGRYDQQIGGQTYRLSQSWVSSSGYQSFWAGSPFAFSNLDYLLSHELGHGLGVIHANGWDCGDQTLYGQCQHVEYGNHFDIMGQGTGLHFNALYKEILGWIKPSEVVTITVDNSKNNPEYILNAIEKADAPHKIAKIEAVGGSAPFYLEHRRAIGFDGHLARPELVSNTAGLFVNRFRAGWVPTSHLLDMSPSSTGWYDDSLATTLNAGQTFSDPKTGITIGPITAVGEDSLSFRARAVAVPCTYLPPGLSFPSADYSVTIAAGGSYSISATVSNEDYISCETVNLTVSMIAPVGWLVSPQTVTLAPLEVSTVYPGLTIPPNTPPGRYSVSVSVVNYSATTNQQTTKTMFVDVVPPPVINSLSPANGLAGAAVTINGSGFNTVHPGNSVSVYSQQGNLSQWIGNSYSNSNGLLNFVFPTTVWQCTNICQQVPTPNGLYNVLVYANGANSNSKIFTVGTITQISIGHPSYHPNGAERKDIGDNYHIDWTDNHFSSTASYAVYATDQDGNSYGLIGRATGARQLDWVVGQVTNNGVPSTLVPGLYYVKVVRDDGAYTGEAISEGPMELENPGHRTTNPKTETLEPIDTAIMDEPIKVEKTRVVK